MALEIERKFLMQGFPEGLELLRQVEIWQGYLSMTPEVRIHRAKDQRTGKEDFRLTIKGDGSLVRTEIITDVEESFFQEAIGLLPGKMIYKDYRSYRLGDNVLEVCCVDPGTPETFYYGEIEFDSEEEANSFPVPDFLVQDVTRDSYYKMKYYWERTRLK